MDSPHVVQALQNGLQHAIDRLLATTSNMRDQAHLFFTLSSDHLNSNFQGWGLRVRKWRGGPRKDALLDRLAKALNSHPSKSTMLLGVLENHAEPNQVIKISKT